MHNSSEGIKQETRIGNYNLKIHSISNTPSVPSHL